VPTAGWSDFGHSIQVGETTIENRFFRVALDPRTGVIRSVYDKKGRKELVDGDAPHGVNELISRWAETGQEESPHQSTIERGECGPVFGSLVVKGDAVGCPQRTQEIILYDRIKRIDLQNRLLRDSTPLLEVYFAFPFNVSAPQVRFEGCNSVIEPLRDQFPGSNTDAYAVQHWVDVFNDEGGVAWAAVDAPIAELGGLWLGYVSYAHHGVTPPGFGHDFLRPGELEKGHIYSYVMDNNFRTNFLNVQVSDVLFRYSLTSHGGDWREGRARNLGWGVANPLVSVCMEGQKGGWLRHKASFCDVDPPNVMLLALKRAEDGDGVILRLVEMEGKGVMARVALPHLSISQAYETNLVEESRRLLGCSQHEVEAPLKPFGITTIRLQID
jgi:hypothetical protein